MGTKNLARLYVGVFKADKIGRNGGQPSTCCLCTLQFCLPPKQLKYADYLVHFKLFYRDIRNLEILSNEDLDFVKTKTKETALSSFRQYNKNPQQNLSKEELAALTNLSKNKDIVIQKSDKRNSVVIVDKDTYINRMENLLSDQRKFEKVTLKNDAFLNFVVNQEKRIDTIFKNLVDSNSMSKEMHKFVKPVGTRPGIMYGNCKVQKKKKKKTLWPLFMDGVQLPQG